jgi:hypothetical protein
MPKSSYVLGLSSIVACQGYIPPPICASCVSPRIYYGVFIDNNQSLVDYVIASLWLTPLAVWAMVMMEFAI